MRCAVGSDDTIAVEVVVGCRVAAKVATIGHDFLTCYSALGAHTLIHEVPDETTLILGIFSYDAPVFVETAH